MRLFHMECNRDDWCVYAVVAKRASLKVALEASGWPQINDKYALLTYHLG